MRQESSVVFVGLNGERVAACVHLKAHEAEAHIGMLAVEPALQKCGAGKALLSSAEAYAIRELGSECFVLTVIEARKELIAFYLRRGYEPMAVTLPYPIDAGVGVPINNGLELVELRKQ